MGASTADCIWQRAESIPELHKSSTNTKYRLLGKSGLRVSEAALGTMTFGDEWGWGSPKAEAQKVYETYREAGGNFIDTANFYTSGTSEKFVGEFIKGHRDSIVLEQPIEMMSVATRSATFVFGPCVPSMTHRRKRPQD